MASAGELVRAASARLAEGGFETPRLDAEVLLRHLLQWDRTRYFLHLHDLVAPEIESAFESLIDSRLTGISVAYLIGEREFMGLTFAVGPGVLVPRPETELLVEWALARITATNSKRVVDIGTGSGAIILSIANALASDKRPHLIGTDLSTDALAYARRNRSAFGLDQAVELVQGDLLTWTNATFDLVLANLPYLTPEQVRENPEIHSEPEQALISGEDGLDAITRLVADLPRALAADGSVILELDPSQAERVAGMLQHTLPMAETAILPDLSGRNRFVTAVLSEKRS